MFKFVLTSLSQMYQWCPNEPNVTLYTQVDFSQFELVGNIWDDVSAQLNKIYYVTKV